PAANSCSGLVPLPAVPGVDSFTSRRPSLGREVPSRPPVVWAFAVYRTLSIGVMTGSFFQWGDDREKALLMPTSKNHYKPFQLRVLRQDMLEIQHHEISKKNEISSHTGENS